MKSLRSLFCCCFYIPRKKRAQSKNKVVIENEFQPDSPFTEEELKRGYTYVML